MIKQAKKVCEMSKRYTAYEQQEREELTKRYNEYTQWERELDRDSTLSLNEKSNLLDEFAKSSVKMEHTVGILKSIRTENQTFSNNTKKPKRRKTGWCYREHLEQLEKENRHQTPAFYGYRRAA